MKQPKADGHAGRLDGFFVIQFRGRDMVVMETADVIKRRMKQEKYSLRGLERNAAAEMLLI